MNHFPGRVLLVHNVVDMKHGDIMVSVGKGNVGGSHVDMEATAENKAEARHEVVKAVVLGDVIGKVC